MRTAPLPASEKPSWRPQSSLSLLLNRTWPRTPALSTWSPSSRSMLNRLLPPRSGPAGMFWPNACAEAGSARAPSASAARSIIVASRLIGLPSSGWGRLARAPPLPSVVVVGAKLADEGGSVKRGGRAALRSGTGAGAARRARGCERGARFAEARVEGASAPVVAATAQGACRDAPARGRPPTPSAATHAQAPRALRRRACVGRATVGVERPTPRNDVPTPNRGP